MAESFQRLIVQVDVRKFDLALVQRVRIYWNPWLCEVISTLL